MARISAARRFGKIFPLLEKAFGRRARFKPHPPVEQALVTALLKNGKEDGYERILKRIGREFVDLNEVRVCTPEDLADALGRAYPPVVATLITTSLTAIFNQAQAMNLDNLLALDTEKAKKKLLKLKPMPSRVAGELILTQLRYKKLPEGAGLLRVAKRTGITTKGPVDTQIRVFRRASSGTPVARVFHAFEMLAERVCTDTDYDCRACPISALCPTGIETLKRLAAEEAKQRAAEEAAAKQQRRDRDRRRKVTAEKQAATRELKKAIEDRSKKLKIPTRKTGKRKAKAARGPAAKMVQASSAEVKPVRKKKKRRATKTKRRSTKKA